ncbi:unnamed protein product, partial [Allacma fusca]
WLLSAIVLSNTYKSFLKTVATTEYRLMTKWSRLSELQEFKLFLPVGLYHNDDLGYTACKPNLNKCSRRCRSRNDLLTCFEEEVTLVIDNFTKILVPKQFFPFCDDYLDTVIEKNLMHPNTALVVPYTEFDYYWNHVNKKMREKNLKFWHNRKNSNDPLLRPQIFVSVVGYVPEKYNHVGKRLRIMITSGLYLFWEKWDKIRFPHCNTHFKGKTSHGKKITGLSMESSLALAFFAFLWSLLGCAFIFAWELLFRNVEILLKSVD